MACPSGCLNGGGQLRPAVKESPAAAKIRLLEFSQLFHCHSCRRPDDSLLVKFLREQNLDSPYLLRTSYHAVPKLELIAPSIIKW
jgi:iron only hydrogenase large subunit-like protein